MASLYQIYQSVRNIRLNTLQCLSAAVVAMAVSMMILPTISLLPKEDETCIDVAVIGGGVGGAYTAWRLGDRELSISVFEYSDRVGGRLFTTDLPRAPGIWLELGGMRFQSVDHPILNRTATEIGLNLIPFDRGFGDPDETVYYTRKTRMRNTDLKTSKLPYNLDQSERKNPFSLFWDVMKNNVNISSNYPSLDDMYSITTKDGAPLYKLSLDNFFGQHASREVHKYIWDLGGWDSSAAGRVGSLTGVKLFSRLSRSPEEYKTIEGGMQKLPQTLMQKFLDSSSRHKLRLNQQLMGIQKRPARGYILRFRRTQTTDGVTTPDKNGDTLVCARKVILAAPKTSVEKINFPAFRNNYVKNLIDSVIDYPAGRIFLAYKSQWWKTNISDVTHTKTDLPNRQTYDWTTGTNNVSIIMASYHDGESVRYWRDLSRLGSPIPGSLPGAYAVTDVVRKNVEKYLSLIYNVKQEDIPEAVGGAMMLWDTYPTETAWSFFKAGVDERDVIPKIYKPSLLDDVFIVSNSWTTDDKQAWIEGTLAVADYVLDNYF